MTHASLFSGIGGFDLAAKWMEWDNIFHCEWNPFGQKVLKHHFPNSISYNDITKTNFSIHAGEIDILTGGFPCQPFSSSGKRLGKEDERHLWPEMLRAIKEIKPTWIVGENVLGIVNWGRGMVFQEVQTDLENQGYEVQAYILPACSKNAPHKRERTWFIAYSDGIRIGKSRNKGQTKQFDKNGKERIASNTNSNRLQRSIQQKCNDKQRGNKQIVNASEHIYTHKSRMETKKWENFPTQSPICGGDDGLPIELDNITFSKWKNESIKAYGNAVVPQVVYEIFQSIQKYTLTF